MEKVWHEIQCASLTDGGCNCRPRDVHAECREREKAMRMALQQFYDAYKDHPERLGTSSAAHLHFLSARTILATPPGA